jgi:protein SCO1/2
MIAPILLAGLLAVGETDSSHLAVIRPAPPFTLTTQDGKAFKSKQLAGKVWVVSFIFTTCSGSCPATTHRMGALEQALGDKGLLKDDRVRLVSISLDPARDTPRVLRGYMKLYDADPEHWTFLTGEEREVGKVIDAWGMWVKEAEGGQLNHPSRIFLVDAKGRIREIYNLAFFKPEWVAEDVRALLKEAGTDK